MFWCLPDFFCQNTIFDLTHFLALAVGLFSGIFLENVFFKIRANAKHQLICMCCVASRFCQNTIVDLASAFALDVGPCSGIVVDSVFSEFSVCCLCTTH